MSNSRANKYFARGKNFYEQSKFSDAISCFSKAIKLNPELSMAYAFRGMSHRKLKQLDVAILDMNKFVEIEPDIIAGVYYHRACMHYERAVIDARYPQDVGEAIWNLMKAEELDPAFTSASTKLKGILFIYSEKALLGHVGELTDEKQAYIKEKLRSKGIGSKLPKFILDFLQQKDAGSNSNIEMKGVIDTDRSPGQGLFL
jgi:tetratricopeptide (TPR) repeat protein